MRTKLQNISIATLLFVMLAWQAAAQEIVFNKVLPPDGNSFNYVNGITQNNNGFMWFATKRGIYKFDGIQYSSYKNSQFDSTSLISNFVESIYPDSNGDTWIGTLGNGLDLLETETGKITHFRHDTNDPGSISNDTVCAILRDKTGILWIATHGGLDQFDAASQKFIHFRHDPADPQSLSFNQVRELYEDKHGTIWVGTGSPYPSDGGGPEDGGLNKFVRETGKFIQYKHDDNNNNSLLSNKISAIFEDSDNVLWVGTRLGVLHKMNRQNGTFERLAYDPAHPEKFSGPLINPQNLSYDHITFVHQDITGSYWIGTVESGLYYYNPAIGKMQRFQGTGNATEPFSDRGAWCATNSRDGMLWIGTPQGTIYRINPQLEKIPFLTLPDNSANCFYEEPDGTFWIGTNKGLIREDKKNSTTKQILINANPESPENVLHKIYRDSKGNLMVGSESGLSVMDEKSEKFITYKYDPDNKKSISGSVFAIYEDKESKLWVGTSHGLNLFDRQKGSFERYHVHENPLNNTNFVTSIFEDSTGNFWIGTWSGGGIFQFNKEKGTFKNYIAGADVVCFFEDSDGVLWSGLTQWLLKFDRLTDKFIVFSDANSISGMTDIVGIQEDSKKNLWIGSAEGITSINPERDNSRVYGKENGVGANPLQYLSSCKRSNGEIYFGGANGYYHFYPENFTKDSKPPEIVITQLYLANQAVKASSDYLNESISLTESIKLPFNQNSFSFDFVVIDYANPESVRQFFMLENWDNDWRPSGSDRRAYYFNIPPGKYTFKIKATNNNGGWTEKEMEITILPPWYLTWTAYIIYFLLFIASVYAFDRFMRRRIVEIERKKNQEKELAHAKEIEKAYTDLKATQSQLIQAEKMASLGELTAGIAHEIQNPLNFVNNFSEVNKELLEEMNEEIEKGNMEEIKLLAKDVIDNEIKINYHGKRADGIVKGMLQHSRASSGVKEPTDINALADEYLRLAYHGLRAKDKSFNADFKTDFDKNIGKINVIPQDLGRVILNLITNAFYACAERSRSTVQPPPPPDLSGQAPEGGIQESYADYKPTVIVRTGFYLPPSGGPRGAYVSVTDNGPGIPSAIMDKIFQPFFTTKPTGEGTGLGLSMSYEIITKGHNGELKVESKEGEGATFTIVLPI